jgi:hypothetical protein
MVLLMLKRDEAYKTTWPPRGGDSTISHMLGEAASPCLPGVLVDLRLLDPEFAPGVALEMMIAAFWKGV